MGGFFVFFANSQDETILNQPPVESANSLVNQIAMACQDQGNWGLYMQDQAGGKTSLIVDSAQNELAPIIEPSNNSLIYILEEEIYNRIAEYSLINQEKNNLIFTKNDISTIKLSPNGRRLLYTENSDGGQDLFYYDADLDQLNKVSGEVVSFGWFLDSNKFVYIRDNKMLLATINPISNELDKDLEIVEGITSPQAVPGASDLFIAAKQTDDGISLVLVDTKQKTIKDFSQIEFAPDSNSTFNMTYAPDQSYIILSIINQANQKAKVWLINRTGQTVQGVLSDVMAPIWSSDSQYLLYSKVDAESNQNIWSYNIVTKEEEQLTSLNNCQSPNVASSLTNKK